MSFFGLTFAGIPNTYKYNRNFYKSEEYKLNPEGTERHLAEAFATNESHALQLQRSCRQPHPTHEHYDETIGSTMRNNAFYQTQETQENTQSTADVQAAATSLPQQQPQQPLSERMQRKLARQYQRSGQEHRQAQPTESPEEQLAKKYAHMGELYFEVKDKLPNLTCREYTSNEEYRLDKMKQVRLQHDPNERFAKPVTTSQEIGWTAKQQAQELHRRIREGKEGTLNDHLPDPIYEPKKSCEETLYAHAMIITNW